jgi:DNA-binding CsgD family transcriptional regulator
MPILARLVVPTAGLPRTFILGPGTHTVGRVLDSDVRLDHPGVSRWHAVIEVGEGPSAVVRDLGSSNGTYVDGERVAAGPLGDVATVAFGRVACEFDWGGEWHDPSTATMPAEPAAAPAVSTAERRVLDLLAAGHTEKEVAARLGLSRYTVHDHVKRLYRAFGVNTRAQLLAAVLIPKPDADKS